MPKQNELKDNKEILKEEIEEVREKLKITKEKVKEFSVEQKKKVFLKAFQHIGTVSHACTAVWLSAKTVYKWLDEDPQFKRDFKIAHKIFVDELEKVAFIRGKQGYSDTMLIFLLKGNRPERYAERVSMTHDGKVESFLTGPVDLLKIAAAMVELEKGEKNAKVDEGQE